MTEALLTGEPQTPTDGKTAAQVPAPSTSSVQDQGKQPTAAEPKVEAPKVETPPKGLLTEEKAAEKTDAKTATPEKYDFKLDGDIKLSPTMQKGAEDAFRTAGLSNEQANKVLNSLAKTQIETQKAQHAEIVKGWSDALASHKDLGGEKLNETLANARKTLSEFLSADARTEFEGLLRDTGLQFNPALIELLANVQKKVGGDKVVVGTKGADTRPKSLEEKLYGVKPK